VVFIDDADRNEDLSGMRNISLGTLAAALALAGAGASPAVWLGALALAMLLAAVALGESY
jgi:hypothetical protein